jgi:hypothetical protein
VNDSDGWRNLNNSLFFLQCFGHRLTEFFGAFGDTVHHGVNLRKRAIDIIPCDPEQIQQADLEPVMYRNLSLTGQYMFRLIDGVFCNNYYAATTQDYHRVLRSDNRDNDELWHLRQNPFLRSHPPVGLPEQFVGCVKYIELSPCFPKIDVGAMLQEESEIRAFLVEGYNSGTYPSVSGHLFALLLSELDRHGIPVILISRFGIRATQDEYRVIEVYGRRVSVLRLYGMVVETALPLLSLVVGRIKWQDWNDGPDDIEVGPNLADHRRELIKKSLVTFFEDRRNILSEELKYSTNRADRFRRMTELRDIEERHGMLRQQSDISRWSLPKRPSASVSRPRSGIVSVPHADFLDLMEGAVEPFEKVGARPNGFLIVNNQGFSLGHGLASYFEKKDLLRNLCWPNIFGEDTSERESCETRPLHS